jgi:hypothetical protein
MNQSALRKTVLSALMLAVVLGMNACGATACTYKVEGKQLSVVCETVAVGIPVTRYPPHRSVRALVSAYGSYLGCVAAKRSDGQGCSTCGAGSQRVASLRSRFQLRRWRWLRWRS